MNIDGNVLVSHMISRTVSKSFETRRKKYLQRHAKQGRDIYFYQQNRDEIAYLWFGWLGIFCCGICWGGGWETLICDGCIVWWEWIIFLCSLNIFAAGCEERFEKRSCQSSCISILRQKNRKTFDVHRNGSKCRCKSRTANQTIWNMKFLENFDESFYILTSFTQNTSPKQIGLYLMMLGIWTLLEKPEKNNQSKWNAMFRNFCKEKYG